jgi:hypothetical protein
MSKRESKIQTDIRLSLVKSGWIVNKIITCSMKGWPDLFIARNGRVVLIEAKQPGEKPRPLQAYRHAQLRKEGIEVIVAESRADVAHLLPP